MNRANTPTAAALAPAFQPATSNSFSGADLEKLGCFTSVNLRRKHAFIYRPEDGPRKIYFLAKGRIKIGTLAQDGRETARAILYPGAIFGEEGLFGHVRYGDFALTLDSGVSLYEADINAFKRVLQTNPVFSLRVLSAIGGRLRDMETRVESLVFRSARARIIDFLKETAEREGVRVGYEVLVRNCPTHKDVAQIAGTSRQTVTTILNDLRARNLIHIERRNILFRDIEHLA